MKPSPTRPLLSIELCMDLRSSAHAARPFTKRHATVMAFLGQKAIHSRQRVHCETKRGVMTQSPGGVPGILGRRA
jgi:hypothetical protein